MFIFSIFFHMRIKKLKKQLIFKSSTPINFTLLTDQIMSHCSQILGTSVLFTGLTTVFVGVSYDGPLEKSIFRANTRNDPLNQELLIKFAHNSVLGFWGRPQLITFAVDHNEPWILKRFQYLQVNESHLRKELEKAKMKNNEELVKGQESLF